MTINLPTTVRERVTHRVKVIPLPGLRAARRRQGVTPSLIRQQLDIGPAELWRLEYAPDRCGATLETAEALASVLGVSLWELEVGS